MNFKENKHKEVDNQYKYNDNFFPYPFTYVFEEIVDCALEHNNDIDEMGVDVLEYINKIPVVTFKNTVIEKGVDVLDYADERGVDVLEYYTVISDLNKINSDRLQNQITTIECKKTMHL